MSHEMIEKVYAFIRAHINEHGFPPTVREIAEGCYINRTYAARYLDILEAQGRLTRTAGKARGLKLTEN